MTGGMAKPPLSVSFHNFWAGLDLETSFFVRALRSRFDLRIESLGRDLQLFSVFGHRLPQSVVHSPALKVWFTGEVRDPQFIVYDLHFGFTANALLPGRSFRFPLWSTNIDWWGGRGPLAIERLLAPRRFSPKPKFCNFIYSNPMSFRAEVFHRLDRRRRVDSLGGVANNAGGRVADKMAALANYQFTLAFENCRSPGYVTEKLLEPLAAGSIPIYWGAPEAGSDFNPAAFIDATDFPSLDALVDHVLSLADEPAACRALAEAPIFPEGAVPYHHRPEFFLDRIEEALATPELRAVGRDLNPLLLPPPPPEKQSFLKPRLRRFRRGLRRRLGLTKASSQGSSAP